ncbi:hypothetical protein Nwi_1624 [Nitrobacter winogradskyi Nb-255]|uniref:Phage protein n=1 Tax=Nitrobacter winogradskyi (strain ATCC 25391 / DSM 10237 / CIP 104748 / NCIMB 11846 / Nb-255) TaxID=323098 RepID=Q3SS56_NITWN|nr:hypothetical protein [Nitrobacter winogradskyi]ABA04742.1 hypothetical protein Nwi_1481 [Nitrobacter winogradskyi Nb-255]ABA04885.1 hypothetical protein Nwi_1624 [Nitrobacter winogradskyi Nb-255]
MRDIASNIGTVQALAPAVQSATIKGETVDTAGFESCAFVINTGATAGSPAPSFTAKLQESDTTTDGDFTDVDATHLVGTLPDSLEESSTYKQSYIGHRKYARVVVTKNSGTSIAAGAVAVLGHARSRPVA